MESLTILIGQKEGQLAFPGGEQLASVHVATQAHPRAASLTVNWANTLYAPTRAFRYLKVMFLVYVKLDFLSFAFVWTYIN